MRSKPNVFTQRRERARAIGLWGAIAGVAIALGPIVGGWLLESFSWTSIFVAMAPVAAVAIALVAASVPTSRNQLVVTVGLIAMAAFYGWAAATTSATLGYGVISVQMVLYGLGMGLTSAPATESIMGAVSRRQAGVGSAVNDSTRLLGGTLGVAVIGSVFASLYGSRLTARLPGGLPSQVTAVAHQSLGAAYAVSGRVPGALGRAVHDAATNAFIHGLSVGCLVAGGVAAAGAILAAVFLPAQPASPAITPPPVPAASPAEEAARF